MTVAKFRELPETGEYTYELLYGEAVTTPRPDASHTKMQSRLRRLLEPKLKAFGEVATGMRYRSLAEYDLRAADVSALSRSRWDAIDPDNDLHGAPELVVQVKSPDNTPRQLQERAARCLSSGALEFWVVDAESKSVSVVRSDGVVIVFAAGSAIPLASFGGGELAVDEIFA